MMNQKKRDTAYLLLAAMMIAVSIRLVLEIPSAVFNPESQEFTTQSPEYAASHKVEAALNAVITSPPLTFQADFESPFRPHKLKRVRVSVPPRPKIQKQRTRQVFRLKGLMQSALLAIIEDSRGKTFIGGKGDTIHEAEIVAINPTSVIMKDDQGTFELTVEEKR
ncbi:MAG: hypothetical protein ACLFQB_00100 [Chitinispirillaceae bacterium]